MQAIITKYHGPTNNRGARISARCASGKASIPYPHGLSDADAHMEAVRALCAKLRWTGHMTAGGLPEGGYAFVFTNSDTFGI